MFRGSILKKGKDEGITIISRQDGKDTQGGYYSQKEKSHQRPDSMNE